MDGYREIERRNGVTRGLRLARNVFLLLVAGLIAQQCLWTNFAVNADIQESYCGATALAKEIKSHDLARYRIAGVREWAATVHPYFDRNIYSLFPNIHGKSYVTWHQSDHTNDVVFSPESCLEKPCDILIWPEMMSPIPMLDNTRGLAAKLPPHWRYIGYFPGKTIFRDRFGYCNGFGVFATDHVAEQVGQLTSPEQNPVGTKEDHMSFLRPGYAEGCQARFHALFGSILRKVDPASAIQQYQTAITVVSGAETKRLDPEARALLQFWDSYAHCGLGILLLPSDPHAAAEHVQTALKLMPEDSKDLLGPVIALAEQGKTKEAAETMLQLMRTDFTRLFYDLKQEFRRNSR
jgi:hypothetical protein